MSAFEQLRELLLGGERRSLTEHQTRIETLEAQHQRLPEDLPSLIESAEQGPRREALHRALGPVVAAAIDERVRNAPQRIVDALFPIIGPAIRKAIAEALRAFVVEINRAMEQSLSPRGLRWRLESWRTGVPFAQVVLKHTLKYRIDHLFLIERQAGILWYRYSAPELPDLDADAIAGMLTAIGDFVRDSVQSGGGEALASATVGEHLLLVREGPKATLAAFVRGVPPQSLLDRLSQKLEGLHRLEQTLVGTQRDMDWPAEAARALDITATLSADGDGQRAPMPRWPFVVALGLLLFGVGMVVWQRAEHRAERDRIVAWIADQPGWQLLRIERDGPWRVQLLRDPDARPVATLADAFSAPIEVDELPYLSLDDAMLLSRAQRTLQPPPGVRLSVADASLTIGGSASADWATSALPLARAVAGLRQVDSSELRIEATAIEQLRAQLKTLSQRTLAFPRGSNAPDTDGLAAIQAESVAAMAAAAAIGARLRVNIAGRSDEGGSPQRNRRLRAERAQILHDALTSAGLDPSLIAIDEDTEAPLAPVATMRWTLE